jgi:hypothetical protein
MLRKFTAINLPRMVHESTVRFIDHTTYYEYKLCIWHDLDLDKMKASYKIQNGYLSIMFLPPETSVKDNSYKDNLIKDIE